MRENDIFREMNNNGSNRMMEGKGKEGGRVCFCCDCVAGRPNLGAAGDNDYFWMICEIVWLLKSEREDAVRIQLY